MKSPCLIITQQGYQKNTLLHLGPDVIGMTFFGSFLRLQRSACVKAKKNIPQNARFWQKKALPTSLHYLKTFAKRIEGPYKKV